MDEKTFNFILLKGEDYQTEFKENIGGIEKDMVAFANAEGGNIFIGVSDDNRIKGIEITNKIKADIYSFARNCDPAIQINISEQKSTLIVHVPESTIKPHRCTQGFYLRVGSISQKLSVDEIRELFNKQGKLFYEEIVNKDFTLKDFDSKKFQDFLKNANISKTLPTFELLSNLNLVNQKHEFKNAAILLFGKTPSRFIPQNIITCVLYKGTDKVLILDRKDFKEDIISNYTDAINFLYKHLRLRYEMKGFGPRKEILEIPQEALKEAIINSISHRDYSEKGAVIQIDIFDDRIEIFNPGELLVKEADFGKKSISRNPLLFGLLQRIELVEHVGSGIKRIRESVAQAKLQAPKFEFTTFFTIIFFRAKPGFEVQEEAREKTREKTREKIVQSILENPKITTEEIALKTMISIKGIEWQIKNLKKENMIERIGPDKGGYWKVTKMRPNLKNTKKL